VGRVCDRMWYSSYSCVSLCQMSYCMVYLICILVILFTFPAVFFPFQDLMTNGVCHVSGVKDIIKNKQSFQLTAATAYQ
jgi:hypothetical protein